MKEAIGDLFSIAKGHKAPLVFSRPISGAYRYIQIEDLRPNTEWRYVKDSKGVLASEKDVLIAWDGANAGTVGWGLKGYAGSTIAILKPVSDKIYTHFFGYFLRSKFDALQANCSGATIPHINRNHLERLEVDYLPFLEQKRIATILEKADRLRCLRYYARELSDTYLQSVFLEMFGNPITNPKGWPQDCLSNLCEPSNGIKAGPFGSSLKKESYSDKGARIYGQEQVIRGDFAIGNYYITYSLFNDFKAYQVKPGDVLISLVGSFGKVAVVPEGIEPGIINPRLLKISPKPKKIKSIFLAHCFENPATQMNLLHISHGGTMGILNAGLLRELKMIVPPIYIQEQFVRIVRKFERLQSQQREAERQSEHIFQTLMHRAFTGELG